MAIKALVVGGTSGIGYAMACRVAAAAATEANPPSVIIAGRTKPENLPHPNMEFRRLDATSMREIKQYTDELKSAAPGQQLDMLIMTQGIFTVAGRTETPEGIDGKMALHYYGRQLFIRELLPALREDAKVITVLDAKLGSPDKLLWEDLDLKNNFSLGRAASHCITLNDAMVQYHAAQQRQLGVGRRHFVHAFPGGVNTPGITREMPWYLRPLVRLVVPFTVTPDTCAKYLLDGAVNCTAAGEKEGRFWSNIDNKGQLVKNKAIWSDEQMEKIADHTWGLIDKALAGSST